MKSLAESASNNAIRTISPTTNTSTFLTLLPEEEQ